MRYVAAILVLTLVYALALASFHPWDLAVGVSLSTTLLLSFGRLLSGAEPETTRGKPSLPGRLAAFIPFTAAVARNTLIGAWRVLLVTLRLGRPASPGVVAVPLGERTPTGVAVAAFLAAFTPDTLLIGVDEEERVMLIHAIDAANPDAVRESQQEFYRRYQRRVFP